MMALFTVLTSVSFVKFVILIMMIKYKDIVQEIDEQSAKCTEAQVKLDEIYQRTVDGEK